MEKAFLSVVNNRVGREHWKLKQVATEVAALIQFRKANPLKWDDLQEHLKSLEISQFGAGEGTTAEGGRVPALGAIHKDGQIAYVPTQRQLTVRGLRVEGTLNLFGEVSNIVGEMIGPIERLKAGVEFFEVEVKAEVEPDRVSPLDIMHNLTPSGIFAPFEEVLDGWKLSMFLYRFFYTPTKVENTIRRTVPWYDLQFYPEIENPDRFIVDIVSRDNRAELVIRHAKTLFTKALEFLEQKEREVGR
jgi:hypothetical protein